MCIVCCRVACFLLLLLLLLSSLHHNLHIRILCPAFTPVPSALVIIGSLFYSVHPRDLFARFSFSGPDCVDGQLAAKQKKTL
jgi:hypothetical protein